MNFSNIVKGAAILIIAILTFFAAIGILYPLLFFMTLPVVIIFEVVIIRAVDKKNKKPQTVSNT